jgi:tetratricopeptide (TPR) repeat protein
MSGREVLDSWKNVAAYLRRDVRTCQTWEKELGLPVHRLNGSPKARVFAYRDEIDRWIKDKLREREASEALVRRTRFRRVLIAAAALIVLALAGFLFWRFVIHPDRSSASSDRPTIAVLAFENLSRDPSLDPWKDGLPELLITELSQSRFLSVLTRDQTDALIGRLKLPEGRSPTDEDLARLAAEGGLTQVVTGSFLGGDEKIVVTLSLREARTGQIIQRHSVDCQNQDEILTKAGDLALQVKQNLNLSGAQLTEDAEVYRRLEPATGSAEAFKYFLEGRRLQQRMEYPASISYMEKAVEIDPQFAMAYRSMASAYRNLGYMAQALKYGRKALELGERLPELERMLIEANYLFWVEDNLRAVDVLERILKLYPDNLMARTTLSILVLSDLDRVIALRDFVYRHHQTALTANNLAHAYMMMGQHHKAEGVCLQYFQDVGDSPGVRDRLVAAYVCGRKFDAALAEAEKNALPNPGNTYIQTGLGDVKLFVGDLNGAEEIYRRVPLLKAYINRSNLIVLDLVRGKFDDAVAVARRNLAEAGQDKLTVFGAFVDLTTALEKSGQYEEAAGTWDAYLRRLAGWRASSDEDTPPDLPSRRRGELFLKGRLLAKKGLLAEAGGVARELEALGEKSVDLADLSPADFLRGLVEIQNKNPRKAAALFGRACSRLRSEAKWEDSRDFALFYDGLARALYDSGEMREARREYEKITLLSYGRLSHGDLYAKAFYRLGLIAERQGEKARARENYGKFIELWKDADPGLTEVEDAKSRLTALGR